MYLQKSWLKSSWAENCYYLNIYIYICCVVGGKKTICNSGHHVAYMCLCLWFYDILCVFENVKSDDTHKMRIAIDGNSGWDLKFDDGNPTHPSPKSQLKIKTLQFIHVSMTFKTCKASDQDNNQSWLWLSSNEPRFFWTFPIDRWYFRWHAHWCSSGISQPAMFKWMVILRSSGLSRHSVMFSPCFFSVAKKCMILSQIFPWHTFGDASHPLALFYDAQTSPISVVFLCHKHNYKNWYLIITEYNWYIYIYIYYGYLNIY